MEASAVGFFAKLDPTARCRQFLADCTKRAIAEDDIGLAAMREQLVEYLSEHAHAEKPAERLTVSEQDTLSSVASQLSPCQASRFAESLFDTLLPSIASALTGHPAAEFNAHAKRAIDLAGAGYCRSALADLVLSDIELTWVDDLVDQVSFSPNRARQMR